MKVEIKSVHRQPNFVKGELVVFWGAVILLYDAGYGVVIHDPSGIHAPGDRWKIDTQSKYSLFAGVIELAQ